MAMISWKQSRFHLRGGLLVGACIVTGCAGLKDSTQGKFFLITSFNGSLSSVPYGLSVTMEGFEPYSQSHVWGMFPAGVDFNICPLLSGQLLC
jgi:hypothetical protein